VARGQLNAQVDAAKAFVTQAVPADQRAAVLAQLEAIRAQANDQLDAILASCPA
jgi:hypothetical protein